MNNYNNIPDEFKKYEQWVLWKKEEVNGKLTKVPYSKNGNHASVLNPYSWCSFETVLSLADKYDGIGFVLTRDDPFIFIDMDACDDAEIKKTQLEIWGQFQDTYSELSPSGNGLHILGKGRVNKGVKKNYIEIYSSHRFMTMTGNVFNNKPLANLQARVDRIYSQIAPLESVTNYVLQDEPIRTTDEEVLENVWKMKDGDKFRDLYAGDWNLHFKSQSEADLSLMNAIGIVSRNSEQIVRIFRSSGLAVRDKAKRDDYVKDLVRKTFDNYLPPADITEYAKKTETVLKEIKPKKEKKQEIKVEKPLSIAELVGDLTDEFETIYQQAECERQYELINKEKTLQNLTSNYSREFRDVNFEMLPDGVVKEIARFMYAQSPRPIKSIATAATLAFLAGVCGRAYNVSGTGLNQYFILLAQTGLGKESMAQGINKLIRAVTPAQPKANSFVGLGDIASGQALVRYLGEYSNSFLSVQGEVSALFYKITATNAPSHYVQLKKVLLDLYNKSGRGNVLFGTHYSDNSKNIAPIEAPAFSMLGESVPRAFYKTLDDGLIEDGLMARLTIFECEEDRPLLNEEFNTVQVPDQLKQFLQILISNCLTLNSTNRVIDIELEDEAKQIMRDFDRRINGYMNESHDDVLHQLWNRAALKIYKTAALFAIGDNLYNPKISKTHISYATNIILKTTENILSRYKKKEIGSESLSTDKQLLDLEIFIGKILYEYNNLNDTYLTAKIKSNYVIPHRLIADKMKYVRSYKEFKHPTKTIANVLRENIHYLIEQGKMERVNDVTKITELGLKGTHYITLDPQHFIQLYLQHN